MHIIIVHVFEKKKIKGIEVDPARQKLIDLKWILYNQGAKGFPRNNESMKFNGIVAVSL